MSFSHHNLRVEKKKKLKTKMWKRVSCHFDRKKFVVRRKISKEFDKSRKFSWNFSSSSLFIHFMQKRKEKCILQYLFSSQHYYYIIKALSCFIILQIYVLYKYVSIIDVTWQERKKEREREFFYDNVVVDKK